MPVSVRSLGMDLDLKKDAAKATLMFGLLILPIVIRLPTAALGGKLTLLEPVTLAALCFWFWSVCLGARRVVRIPGNQIALIVFYMGCVLSFFASPDPSVSMVALLTYVNGGLILFLMYQLIRCERDVTIALRFLLLGSVVPLCASVVGSAGLLVGLKIPGVVSSAGKLTASFMFSSQLPSYMLILIPLLLQVASSSAHRTVVRVAASVGTIISMFAILFSGSRSGVAAAIAVTFLYLLRRSRGTRRVLVLGLIGAVVVSLGPAQLSTEIFPRPVARSVSGMTELFRGGDGLSTLSAARAEHVGLVVEGLKRSPFLGIGLGAFHLVVDDLAGRDVKNLEVHNTLLSVLVETGLVGFAGFLLFGVACLVEGMRGLWGRERGKLRSVQQALLFGLAANFAHQQFHFGLRQPVFWIGLGLLLAVAHVRSTDREDVALRRVA